MPNPSPETIAYIVAQSPDWAQSDAAIAAAINGAMVPNPVATARVDPKPFDVGALMGLLSPASLGKVYMRPAVVAFRDDCNAQNRKAVGGWIGLALAAGDVTQSEYAAMMAVLSATQPDPNWTATVPAPLVAIGRVLDAADVAAARPGS